MLFRHNLDIDQSLSGPRWTHGASVDTCLIYLNNTISYQNKCQNSPVATVSILRYNFKHSGASLAPVVDIGKLTTLCDRVSSFSQLLK